MRIVLADDHTLVRAGIRSLLVSIPDVQVVAESDDGREALELIARHRPDVALIDIGMPGLSGLEVARRTAKESPRTRVIILSMHGDRTHVTQALRAGVAGYLLKGAAVAELPLALEAVMRGETYLTPKISQTVVQGYLDKSGEAEQDPLKGLTARQREILHLIAEGRTTREMAGLLHVSVKTIETHRLRLMERLDIHDVAGLVRFAVRSGLISPAE
ncbi:MAG TPA: response regulator transcription factor [Patescibacteria group bacterium]|nr:response regulator transcription factor [Patescibacteria group bacterium]